MWELCKFCKRGAGCLVWSGHADLGDVLVGEAFLSSFGMGSQDMLIQVGQIIDVV